MAELRRVLAQVMEVRLQVLGVGVELVDALEVVVAADDVERDAGAVEVISDSFEARRRAGVELFAFRAVFRFS